METSEAHVEENGISPPQQPPPIGLSESYHGIKTSALYENNEIYPSLNSPAPSAPPYIDQNNAIPDLPPPYAPLSAPLDVRLHEIKGDDEKSQNECDSDEDCFVESGKTVAAWGIRFIFPTPLERMQWKTIFLVDCMGMFLFMMIFVICGVSMVKSDDSNGTTLEKTTMALSIISAALCGFSFVSVVVSRSALLSKDNELPHILLVRIALALFVAMWTVGTCVVSVVGVFAVNSTSFAVNASFHGLFFLLQMFVFIYETNECFGFRALSPALAAVLPLASALRLFRRVSIGVIDHVRGVRIDD
jgi:hypothetical protein